MVWFVACYSLLEGTMTRNRTKVWDLNYVTVITSATTKPSGRSPAYPPRCAARSWRPPASTCSGDVRPCAGTPCAVAPRSAGRAGRRASARLGGAACCRCAPRAQCAPEIKQLDVGGPGIGRAWAALIGVAGGESPLDVRPGV